MYRVLIVDDEPEIRQGLQLKVDWEGLGLLIAAEASNGVEAMEILTGEAIDIVITDMNMPVMDGMTFLDACHDQYPSLRLIVITGYEDFQYAKAAVKNHARDYLLKPVARDELTMALTNVKQELDKERRSQDQAAMTEWRLSQYYAKMKEHFIVHLVKEELERISVVKDRARLFELDVWDDRKVRFMTAGLKDAAAPEHPSERSPDKFRLPFDIISRECADKHRGFIQVFRDANYPGLMHFVMLENEALEREFTGALHQNVKTFMGFELRVGIGQAVTGFVQWKEGYITALLAWNLPNDRETGKSRTPAGQAALPEDTIKVLRRYLTRGELSKFSEAIRHELRGTIGSQPRFVKVIFQLYLMLESVAHEQHIALDSREQLWLRPEMSLSLDTVEKAEPFLMRLAAKIERKREIDSGEGDPSLIEAAQHFIDENYMYDLNLTMISEKFNYNSSYFSEMFKAKVGKTFIQYLTEARMNQAVRMLRTTTLSLWDIAELTGFSNASYFSSKFKRMHGLTPSEYRQQSSEKIDSEHPKK
ncbi:response regulator [Paenibacillus harenae]|uniref:response regulator n=1 Tax=Paenibacillus harenae TaxID=306543 RepID=UPI00042A85A4|nr:response regulator [Paenibacillus harenae]